MTPRVIRIAVTALCGAALLGACVGSSSSAETTLAPSATPWRTLPPVAATTIPPLAPIATINYVAREGDYANSIAANAGGGCSGAEILAANPGVTTINAGDIIAIPANCLGPGITEDILNNRVVSSSSVAEESSTTKAKEKYNTYTVRRGDYWVKIARRVGCTYRQLKNANPDTTKLFAGDVLNVPASCDNR